MKESTKTNSLLDLAEAFYAQLVFLCKLQGEFLQSNDGVLFNLGRLLMDYNSFSWTNELFVD